MIAFLPEELVEDEILLKAIRSDQFPSLYFSFRSYFGFVLFCLICFLMEVLGSEPGPCVCYACAPPLSYIYPLLAKNNLDSAENIRKEMEEVATVNRIA